MFMFSVYTFVIYMILSLCLCLFDFNFTFTLYKRQVQTGSPFLLFLSSRYSRDRLETRGVFRGIFRGIFAKSPGSTAQTHSQSVSRTAKHITKLRIVESPRAGVTDLVHSLRGGVGSDVRPGHAGIEMVLSSEQN